MTHRLHEPAIPLGSPKRVKNTFAQKPVHVSVPFIALWVCLFFVFFFFGSKKIEHGALCMQDVKAPSLHMLAVKVGFCELDTNLDMHGEKESQLKTPLHWSDL